jgi:DNA-binding HxlR family transcriptional regulator
VVGERWNLLVVRELTLGPRRYRDLLDGLPGIPTNLLAARLKDLRAAGVISKRTLPPPTAVTVYELTDAGRALRPAMRELRAWGRRHGPAPSETDIVQPAWALLSASARPTELPEGRTCELRVGAEFFHLYAKDSRLVVRGGPAPVADGAITLSAETLYNLMAGRRTAARHLTIDGNPTVTGNAVETLLGALAEDTTQPAGVSRPRRS